MTFLALSKTKVLVAFLLVSFYTIVTYVATYAGPLAAFVIDPQLKQFVVEKFAPAMSSIVLANSSVMLKLSLYVMSFKVGFLILLSYLFACILVWWVERERRCQPGRVQ